MTTSTDIFVSRKRSGRRRQSRHRRRLLLSLIRLRVEDACGLAAKLCWSMVGKSALLTLDD
jgi:hypothetical protein